MAWISFGALPCRKKNLIIARVSMLLKSCASLKCFRASSLLGRYKDLPAPGNKIFQRCVISSGCSGKYPARLAKPFVEVFFLSVACLQAIRSIAVIIVALITLWKTNRLSPLSLSLSCATQARFKRQGKSEYSTSVDIWQTCCTNYVLHKVTTFDWGGGICKLSLFLTQQGSHSVCLIGRAVLY